MKKVGKFNPKDIVNIDLPPVRKFNLADAANILQKLAKPLKTYIRSNKGRVYGSFNEWLKVKSAKVPNDIDIAFRNPKKAISDIVGISKQAGFKARRVHHGVEILKDGKWTKIADVDSLKHHLSMLPGNLSAAPGKIEGIRVESIGEQYIRQATVRANRGRGGCSKTRSRGRGSNRRR